MDRFKSAGRRNDRGFDSRDDIALPTIASVFLRFALAATFADSVCDRLGIWGPPGSPHVAWGDFGHFEAYVRILNWFSPAALIPAIALTVTILETGLTIALALGLWLRWTSIAAGALLLLFGLAMTAGLRVAALACRRDELTREELGRRDALSEALKRSTEEVIETSDGWAFRLRADPAVFSAAAEWVTLERRCCPFLRFELRWAGGAAAPWLRLGGGDGVKEYLAPGARALMTRNSPT